MEPDIVILQGEKTYILDTKWKMINGNRPSDDDLKQMYVYTKYFESSYTALVYPDDSYASSHGSFLHEKGEDNRYPCSLIKLKLPLNPSDMISWQKQICGELLSRIGC